MHMPGWIRRAGGSIDISQFQGQSFGPEMFFFSMSLWVSSGNSVFVLPPKNISPCVCDCFQKEWGFVHRFSHVFQAI